MFATATSSPVSYFKRYRMELDLLGALPPIELPTDYVWVAWEDGLLETHAEVKYRCFSGDLDGVVFPNLSNRIGCLRLMREIRSRPGFHPASTWMIASNPTSEPVATIQGIADRSVGGIQNVGVIPSHRGKKLGRALVLQALHGFQQAGLTRSTLEVTAQNEPAVHLYRQLGFRFRKTLYRAVEQPTYPIEMVAEPEWVV